MPDGAAPLIGSVKNVLTNEYVSDASLYTKGITPYRGFRLKDVKDFFGVKGNKDKVLEMLEHLKVTMENFEELKA